MSDKLDISAPVTLKIDDFLYLIENLMMCARDRVHAESIDRDVIHSMATRYGFVLDWRPNHDCYYAQRIIGE
jgi:hypothetical protein